ncbi:MAG: glycerol-3-phosphate dehydrogenase [Gemmatimonadota bacterium]|nr:glycerol-3-phosphate dehydrogenase [Gemmatimonadota bacterium]
MNLNHATLSRQRATLDALAAQTWDILVIGGGITGAGIARDASLRGLSVALVDRHDLAWGTSSRSSRLIHGGLRYLEQGRLGLVFESLRERRHLLALAPHLVRPQAFILPVHRGDRVPRWKLEIGMWLYDLLAWRGNLPRHQRLGKRAMLQREPMIRERGLTGGALYYDAQCDDARLVVAVARAAAQRGAAIANWTSVTALHAIDGRIARAELADQLTGATGEIRFRSVVNATGPWTDELRKLEDPGARPVLRPTKGVHVLFRRARLGHQHAITFTSPIDGRVMFVLPWGEHSYVGTTDTDSDDSPERITTTRDDVHYLIRSVNALFPSAHLTEEDVTGTWAGLRPMLRGPEGAGPSAVSREHRILRGHGGMWTIAGGKLTTWRSMAAELVDRVARELGQTSTDRTTGRIASATEPLPGGDSPTLAGFQEQAEAAGLSTPTAAHLVRHYGGETAAILNLLRDDPSLATPIHPDHPAIAAEVLHAARREFAVRVDDVLARRVHLAWETSDQGVAAADRVAELLGRELGWSEEQCVAEAAAYREAAPGHYGWAAAGR